MAAAVRVKARPNAPVGYEVNEKVTLASDVTAGDLLKYSGTMSGSQALMVIAGTAITEADGIALQDGYNGQAGFSVGVQGEMDGWSGLTPGVALYPSASVAGGLDTTAAGVIRVKAITTTRIRFNFV